MYHEKRKKLLPLLLVLVLAALALAPGRLGTPGSVAASAVTNYYTRTVEDGATVYTTAGGNTLSYDVSGYGSTVIHVVADASATTSTLTIAPYYSNDLTAGCVAVSNWFAGTDYLPYSAPAEYTWVGYGAAPSTATWTNYTDSLAFTGTGSTTITANLPYVVSSTAAYVNGSVSVVTYTNAAIGGFNSVAQSFTVTGDGGIGREFIVYGRCMRLKLSVSYGTITPTIWVMSRDLYE